MAAATATPAHSAGGDDMLPPGSSKLFVSTDPTLRKCVQLYIAGDLAGIDALLPTIPPADAAEIRDLISRLRREYGQTRDELLTRVREKIPDVTDADLDRWIAAGQVQSRLLDGQRWFFRREPGQIFRFCPEAMTRAAAAEAGHPAMQPAEEAEWSLLGHLTQVATAAGDDPAVLPVKHRITYTLTVKPNQPEAKKGSILRVWLPFPQEYRQQKGVRLVRSDPPGVTLAPAGVDGNPVTGVAQRTAYFESTIDDPTKPMTFTVQFEFTTSAWYPKLDDARVKPAASAANELSTYLEERPPHIVFTPELRAKVKEIVGDDTNPLIKARKIFYWVDENVKWTPEEEYCVIPNLSMHGFTRGKGDCGVASLTYITMCRIAGVPARWQSGWTTKPVGWNMHDWSEIYIEPWGWLPVDASYGRQKSDDPSIRDFYFGHTDSYRLIVNLDYGHELTPPKGSFRSEPLDFQRGEVEVDGKNLYFDRWDYVIEFERQPGP